jgi:hypothetical protein
MTDQVNIDDDTVFAVPDHVLSRRVSGEVVILDLDSDEYFGLQEVGARVWELVETGAPFSAMVATLLEEYEVEAHRLAEDVRALLAGMLAGGLIVACQTA